ncbi:MAG: hypothetical protein ABW007_19395 [Chitinophagaceae bacterium]
MKTKAQIDYILLTGERSVIMLPSEFNAKETVIYGTDDGQSVFVTPICAEKSHPEEGQRVLHLVEDSGEVVNLPPKNGRTVYVVNESVRRHPTIANRNDVASLFGLHCDLKGRLVASGLVFNF